MRDAIVVAAVVLAMSVPMRAQDVPAAPPAASHSRSGSWELSLGGGAAYLDKQIVDVIALTSATQRLVPGGALRLGYNLGRSWNLSAGTFAGYAKPATVLQPFGAITWTPNINAGASPFLTVGGGITSISWKTDSSYSFRSQYSLHGGIGLRLMLGRRTALRVEVREEYEKYADTTYFSRAAFYPTATLGFSFFFGGRPAAAAVAPESAPVVAAAPAAEEPAPAAPAPAEAAPALVPGAAMTLAVAPAVDTLGALGQTRQFAVTAQDSTNAVVATPDVVWTTSDASIAFVSETGLVTAVRNGSTTITAAVSGGPSASASVTVRQMVAAVAVMPTAMTLTAAGATARLAVAASDANGRPVTGKVITWTDSLPSVATIGPGGVVTAVANGTTRISATVEGITGSSLVSVALPAAGPAPSAFTLPGMGETVVLRNVIFRPNSFRLPPDAQGELAAVAEAMLAIPSARWEIGGYTSDMGDPARNQTLSRRRALAVRTYLVQQGVPASRLTAAGYGSQNPIASNATATGRRQNMRVEIKRLR